MKKLFLPHLLLLLMMPVQSAFAASPIESAFMDFFNTKEYGALSKRANVSIVHSGGMVADAEMQIDLGFKLKADAEMQIDLGFKLKGVEKVLVLKIPNSGYDNYGSLNKSCRDEPVFIAGYNLDPGADVSNLSLRMRSQCGQSLIRLVWVRTAKGDYYRGYIEFKAVSSANTVDS